MGDADHQAQIALQHRLPGPMQRFAGGNDSGARLEKLIESHQGFLFQVALLVGQYLAAGIAPGRNRPVHLFHHVEPFVQLVADHLVFQHRFHGDLAEFFQFRIAFGKFPHRFVIPRGEFFPPFQHPVVEIFRILLQFQ